MQRSCLMIYCQGELVGLPLDMLQPAIASHCPLPRDRRVGCWTQCAMSDAGSPRCCDPVAADILYRWANKPL